MFYILLSILSSGMIGILMRAGENRVRSRMVMFLANYAVCLVLASVHLGGSSFLPKEEGIGFALILGLVMGTLYLINFMLLQWNIAHNGMMLSSTFMKLGVLVPTVMAMAVFGEMPEIVQALGIGLALIGIVLINFDREEEKTAGGGSVKLMLIVLLLIGGVTDSLANVFDELGNPALEDQFLVYTFAAALVICLLLTVYKREKCGWQDAVFGVLIGVPNYYSVKFLLKALESVNAVIAYPVTNVGTIIFVTAVSILVFGERPGKMKLAAIGVILMALVFLNM